jgi:uncharacterized membrane-anchored protein
MQTLDLLWGRDGSLVLFVAPSKEDATMKYVVRSENKERKEFELTKLTIIKEWTRTIIFISTIAVWLAVILVSAYLAAVARRHGDLEAIVNKLTPIVGTAVGWYLGKVDRP